MEFSFMIKQTNARSIGFHTSPCVILSPPPSLPLSGWRQLLQKIQGVALSFSQKWSVIAFPFFFFFPFQFQGTINEGERIIEAV